MSKSLSIATVIEKNRLSSDVAFLMALEIEVVDPTTHAVVTTMRVVRNTESIVFNGNTFQPAAFDIEVKEEAGAQPTINLSIKDYTKAVQGYMQAYGGGVGFNVTLYIINSANLSQPPEIAEYFQVVGASATNYVAEFTLGAESTLMKVFPRRRQTRDYCQWKYKSTECGYVGGLTSCDLSLQGPNGCAAHNNTINFGGYPGINPRMQVRG